MSYLYLLLHTIRRAGKEYISSNMVWLFRYALRTCNISDAFWYFLIYIATDRSQINVIWKHIYTAYQIVRISFILSYLYPWWAKFPSTSFWYCIISTEPSSWYFPDLKGGWWIRIALCERALFIETGSNICLQINNENRIDKSCI